MQDLRTMKSRCTSPRQCAPSLKFPLFPVGCTVLAHLMHIPRCFLHEVTCAHSLASVVRSSVGSDSNRPCRFLRMMRRGRLKYEEHIKLEHDVI